MLAYTYLRGKHKFSVIQLCGKRGVNWERGSRRRVPVVSIRNRRRTASTMDNRKKYKRTHNDLQNITHKTKDRVTLKYEI